MKIYLKIYLSIVGLLIAILGIDGYLSINQDVTNFNRDMKTDALLIGQAMSGMVEHTWKVTGEDEAIRLINNANKKEHSIKIRWVWLDNSAAAPYLPQAPLEMLFRVLQGQNVSLVIKTKEGKESRCTYVPITTGNQRQGAIEFSESLLALKHHIYKSCLRVLVITMLLLLASALLLWYIVKKMITKPLKRLIEKAREIGRGNLAVDIFISGKDEISELGATMNTMSKELSTARKALQTENEARLAALDELRHAERLATIGKFSAEMAHELGTPLNVITGRSKLIRTESLGPNEVIECSRIIGEQAERVTKIIRNLLGFARHSSPKRTLIDIEQIAGLVLEILKPRARKKQIVLEFTKNGQIPRLVIDPIQIQQVMINLITNGIQAMPHGGRLGLELGVQDVCNPNIKNSLQKNYATVRITDEGEGIAEENLKHLFDPFFSTKETGEGTGLGLSITHGIVEDYGGWIEVKSQTGQGSCFTVFLPLEEDK